MSPGPTRILILGGGFGGVYTALTLEQLLRHDLRRGAVELTLVNRENYLVFQPMLPEVISGSIGLVDTITPIRRLCPNTNLYTRPIEKVDIQRRRVLTAAGLGTRPCKIEYDHLVIALGNVPSLADLPGLAEHALPFKYLGDALTLRNRIIHTLEEADIEPDPGLRRTLLTFVVAGGGFSGAANASRRGRSSARCRRCRTRWWPRSIARRSEVASSSTSIWRSRTIRECGPSAIAPGRWTPGPASPRPPRRSTPPARRPAWRTTSWPPCVARPGAPS